MSKAKIISKEYADKNTCYADDSYLQYRATRKAVEYGYRQAEKDLELSWEDIDTIYNLLCEEFTYQLECGKRPQKEACQEILKRFNGTKEL